MTALRLGYILTVSDLLPEGVYMKNRIRIFLFSAAAAVICMVSAAAEDQKTTAKPLTVEDAVKTAIAQNITIKQNQITVDADKRAKDHSWNSISPSASVSAGVTKPNDTSSLTYDWTAYTKASVSISFSPSLYTSIKKANLNYEQGLITYEQACRSIELSVRSTFYGLLYEQENLVLQERNLATAKQQYETNQSKYQAGRIPQLDVLTAQVTYEKLKPTVESAEITLKNDMESFKQLLNINLDTEITLSGSLDDVLALGSVSLGSTKIDDLVEKALSVASLEKQVESAKNSLMASRFSAYGPTISAGWTYQPTIKSNDTSNATDSGSLALSATIPLDGWLPWSTGSDNVATANDNVKNLELQLENAKTTAKVNIQNYSRQIDQAQSTIQSLQANINLAQQSYDMTLEAYNHGTKDLLSLQTASDSLLQAKVSLKSEAYTLIKAVLNLENTSGVPFGTLGK